MGQITKGIKYWGQLLLLPVYWLSVLFPRNRYIWLFGSTFGKRFADNPRYLYLYVSQHSDVACNRLKAGVLNWQKNGKPFTKDVNCKRIRPIWISHDKDIVHFLCENGYEAYYYHSVKGIWYALRGKVYLFDNYSKDINFWLSGGAIKINLWHGVGNKCINYDNRHDKVRHPKNAWEWFKYFPRRLSDEKPSHYILTTSPMMSNIFARAFQVPESNIIEAGYPRNDILFDECNLQNLYQKEEWTLLRHIEKWKAEGKIILGYLPTFRPSEVKFFEVCDLSEWNQYLTESNMIMICKLHPKSVCKRAFEEIVYSNIYYVTAEVDVNSFLGKIDLLVADYSSVYSDYMLLGRPVVAFHYDYKEYFRDTRDAYFDFKEYMPEVRAYSMTELKEGIQRALQLDEASAKREAFRRKLYRNADCGSAERLVKHIKGILKEGKRHWMIKK